MKMSTYAVGIDLGTTHSCVAVYQHGKVEIIANDHGSRTTPSYVSFTEDVRLVGEAAASQASLYPKNTIYDAKRLIGRRFNEEAIQADLKYWPFTVVCCDEFPKIQVTYEGETVLFAPEEISAMILSKMKETAEAYLEQRISRAVITVPAYFNDYQKQATITAGKMAGLEVMYILSEPVAAAIAYAVQKENVSGTVLVFDIGGGTLDVSIIYIDDMKFVVKSISGNTHLGGEDFTNNLVNYIVNLFRNKHDIDLSRNMRSLSRLKQNCELVKSKLSFQKEVKLFVDSIMDGVDLIENVTRAKFNELNAEKFMATLQPVRKALNYANMTPNDIDKVIMVGGSSRIPKIEDLLKELFGGDKIFKSINAEEAIAYGAGAYAAKLDGINLNDRSNFIIQDVTPQSLSVGVHINGVHNNVSVIIPKNSEVPVSKTKQYRTREDWLGEPYIQIYEGENESCKENTFLGRCILSGFPPKACINITFHVDTNRVLKVTTVHVATGNLVEKIIDRRLKE